MHVEQRHHGYRGRDLKLMSYPNLRIMGQLKSVARLGGPPAYRNQDLLSTQSRKAVCGASPRPIRQRWAVAFGVAAEVA